MIIYMIIIIHYDNHHDLRRGITESSPELADVLYQFPAHHQSKLLQVMTVMMVLIVVDGDGELMMVVGDFPIIDFGDPPPSQKSNKTIHNTFT